MKTIPFFILFLIGTKIFGQQAESLLVNILKSETKDSFYICDISVQNKSDSIVCILHSIFMNLTADTTQGIALYFKNKEKQEYSLHRAFEDTTYIAEAIPQKGEVILPHHTLYFKIKILKTANDILKYLTIQYFYLTDLCYEDFKREMKNKVGSWYYKYNRLKKSVKI
jgi:hypothetical protein